MPWFRLGFFSLYLVLCCVFMIYDENIFKLLICRVYTQPKMFQLLTLPCQSENVGGAQEAGRGQKQDC